MSAHNHHILTSVFLGLTAGVLLGAGWVLSEKVSLPVPVLDSVGAQKTPLAHPSAILPHHLVAEQYIRAYFDANANEAPEVVILLSPDHWGRAQDIFSTTDANMYAETNIATELRDTLRGQLYGRVGANNTLLDDEHGLRNLVPFIHETWPDAELLPIAVASVASEGNVDVLMRAIDAVAPENTLVLASTDFSHYLPSVAADLHDTTSITALARPSSSLRVAEVDCWQCIYGAKRFGQLNGATHFDMQAHTNNAKIANAVTSTAETTSYVIGRFVTSTTDVPTTTVTMLMTGDMMLGRYVETLMRERGMNYPFEEIGQLLHGTDLTIANLEGPVLKNHRQTPRGSVRFAFDDEMVPQVLAQNSIDIVSLGNNHTQDYGWAGYEETRDLLAAAGIDSFGDAVANGVAATTTVRGQDIIMLGYNEVYPSFDLTAAVEQIQTWQEQQPDAFLMVFPHWGNEYQLTSHPRQRRMAEAFIDAGADVIVGHHPHVTQEVDEYKGKLIFYSLGNFIFDQYFSKDTQEGYALGLELTPTTTTYRLFPLKSELSQPDLMLPAERDAWLDALAQRSAPSVADAVRHGILTRSR